MPIFAFQSRCTTRMSFFDVRSMTFCSWSYIFFPRHHSLTLGRTLVLLWCWKGLPAGGWWSACWRLGDIPWQVFTMSLWTRNPTPCPCLSSFPLKKTLCLSSRLTRAPKPKSSPEACYLALQGTESWEMAWQGHWFTAVPLTRALNCETSLESVAVLFTRAFNCGITPDKCADPLNFAWRGHWSNHDSLSSRVTEAAGPPLTYRCTSLTLYSPKWRTITTVSKST